MKKESTAREFTPILLYLLITTLIFLFTFILLLVAPVKSHAANYIFSFQVLAIASVTYIIWSSAAKSKFDPFLLFLFSMTLFLSGHQLINFLGLSGSINGILHSQFHPNILEPVLFQVSLSFACFGYGGFLAIANFNKNKIYLSSPSEGSGDKSLRFVGWLIVIVTLFPHINHLKFLIENAINYGYLARLQDLETSPLQSINRVLSGFFIPANILIIAGSRNRRGHALFAFAAICATSFAFILIGSRTYAIMPLLAAIWVWHRQVAKIPQAALLFVGSAFLFIIFPAVAYMRLESMNSAVFDISQFLSAYSSIENPIISILDEMGNSGLLVTAYIYELVPAVRPFDFGYSYFIAFTTLFPNLMDIERPINLSRWLANYVDPIYSAKNGGFGFSYVAEAYLNFGWVGVVLISGAIGYFMARISIASTRNSNSLNVAFAACVTLNFLFLPRAEFHSIARETIIYALIPYFFVIIVNRHYQNK